MSETWAALLGALIGALAGVAGGAIAQLVAAHQARVAHSRELLANFVADIEKIRLQAIFLKNRQKNGEHVEAKAYEFLDLVDTVTRSGQELALNASKNAKQIIFGMVTSAETLVMQGIQIDFAQFTVMADQYQGQMHRMQDTLHDEIGKHGAADPLQ